MKKTPHKAKGSPVDWKGYIKKLADVEAVISAHKESGHTHSAKKHEADRDAILVEIDLIKRHRGI